MDEVYKKDILSRLFDPNEDWDIAVRDSRLDKTYAPANFVQSKSNRGAIYSYGGKIFAGKGPKGFKTAALQLLGLNDSSDWRFTMDIHPHGVRDHIVSIKSRNPTSKACTWPKLSQLS